MDEDFYDIENLNLDCDNLNPTLTLEHGFSPANPVLIRSSDIIVNNDKIQLQNESTSKLDANKSLDKSDSDSSSKDLDELFDLKNEKVLMEQYQRVESKVKSFFEKICTKAFVSIKDTELDRTTQNTNIQYGNLIKNYDANNSITNVQTTSLFSQRDNEDQLTSFDLINFLKSNQSLNLDFSKKSIDIYELSLVRKSCLIYLIERNRQNHIYCPFDESAYYKFQNLDNEFKIKIEDIIAQSSQLNVFDSNEKIEKFMPNCIAMFLMQFFFDIYQPSELKLFPNKTIDIILKLKSTFNPELNLTNELLTAYVPQNVLWNCFALFKNKFNKTFKIGFFNYLISLFCLLKNYDNLNENLKQKEREKYFKISQILPYFIKALILNGFLKEKDLAIFYIQESSLYKRNNYLLNLADLVYNVIKKMYPLRLKDLCRIEIKDKMKNFNHQTIDCLNLNDECKYFMLFNSDFERFYQENEYLFS